MASAMSCGSGSDESRCRLSSWTKSKISFWSMMHTSILACLASPHTQQKHSKIVDSRFFCWGGRHSEIHRTKKVIITVISSIVRRCSREDSWINGGLGEVVRAEEGGSILILDHDVVRRELMARPIATRLGTADEFSHADDKVLRVETRLAADTKSYLVT
jgi:hypothetical protein